MEELYVPEKAEGERIYGFTVKDKTIYIQLATAPNDSGMENATVKTANLYDYIEKSLNIKDYEEGTRQAMVYAPEDTEGIMFFASYDENDKLIDCKFKVCSGAEKIKEGINQYTVPDGFHTNGAETVKVIIWQDMTAFKPLCEAFKKQL